jgi:N-acyl-D-amino-acid deacylase
MTYDLLIRNGRIVDGSGMPAYMGDVGVRDGLIMEVGGLDGAAHRTIDAHGLVIAPGFIDNHCHYDAQVTWDPLCTFSCYHGVTTVVFGNCSVALAPAREGEAERRWLSQLLSRVEAIPYDVLETGIPWAWGTIPEYLDILDKKLGMNAGVLIGHSAVRRYVMGEASQRREATPAEVEAMATIVREGMAAGALGISFSRSRGFVRPDEEPMPAQVASLDEIYTLAAVLREFGTGIIQVDGGAPHELNGEMCTKLFQISGRPVAYISITPLSGEPDAWKSHLAFVEETAGRGNMALPMVSPRPVDQRFTMENCQLFNALPTWGPIMRGTMQEKLRALSDPSLRAQLHQEAAEGDPLPYTFFTKRWDRMFVTKPALEKNAHLKGRSIASIAQERGVSVVDAFLDLAVEEGLETGFVLEQVAGADEEAMKALLNSPLVVMGLSDSGAHVVYDPGYGFCTYFLRRWVGDDGIMSLEQGVRKLTFDQASLFGIHDRGLIRPGMVADLVVFDPDTIDVEEVEEVHDLPGGALRQKQVARGIEWTVVNGQVLMEKGEHTGAYPGRVVRNSAHRAPVEI